MNRWTPAAAASLVALAVAIGCGGGEAPPPASPQPYTAPNAAPPPPPPANAPPANPPPAGVACNNQPNMNQAKEHLRRARQLLEQAEHNKGGWRERADNHTGLALAEVERGCQFADTH